MSDCFILCLAGFANASIIQTRLCQGKLKNTTSKIKVSNFFANKSYQGATLHKSNIYHA